MTSPIRVVAARQSCLSCPSQWDGMTDDGRPVYARYRFGRLTVQVNGDTLIACEPGDEFDGYIDQYTLADLCAPLIEWPWSRDAR